MNLPIKRYCFFLSFSQNNLMIKNLSVLFVSLLFIITPKIVLATDIYEGQYHKNSINNIFGTGLNFYLPPGDWQVESIEDSGNSDQEYKDITLWSDVDDFMWISVPITSTPPGYFWKAGGLKNCPNVKKNDIYTFAAIRGRTEGVLCVAKWTGDDGFEWADVNVSIRSTSGNLKWTTQTFSTDYKLLNQSINERERKNIAKTSLESLIKGFQGNNPSGASALLALFN